MPAGTFTLFDKAKLNITALGLLSASNSFKWTLHTSTYTPGQTTNEVYADLTNELATGNGYTAGGLALPSNALTLIAAQTVSSITKSGQTATVTTASAHGLSSGMLVPVSGASDALYNGTFPITVTGSTTFTYTMTGTPAANASGTLAYGAVIKFSGNAGVWTASGGSIPAWRTAALRAVGTIGGKVDPVIGYFVGDTTAGGTDVPATTSGNTLTITPNAAGLTTAA